MIQPHLLLLRAGPQALAVASALALVCAAAVTAQQPTRDNAAATSATATVSGTVFINGPAKPTARRVRVTLTDVAHTSPGQTTTTDDKGTFAFRDVPAGRFEVQAFKDGYLRASYGASRPERTGTPIVVKDGEAVANIALTIARGGVITGVVRDVRGRPVPGVHVQVLRLGYNAVTGERTLSVRGSSANSGNTDDRGEYRAYNLPPGGYLVLAAVEAGTGPGARAAGLVDIRLLTSAEVQQALQAARGGAANTPLAAASPSAPSSSSAPARVNYAPVFHPGVPDIGGAATINLGLSEERTGVDVTIQLVSTATVSGTIQTSAGVVPESLNVTLTPAGPPTEMPGGVAAFRGVSIESGPGGTYTFGGVAPGTYTLRASTLGGRPVPGMPALWASAEVRVSGQNVEMPLTVEPGVTITGRVVFEGSRPTPAELQTLRFGLVRPGSVGTIQTSGGGRGIPQPTTGGGRVDAEGRFAIDDVPPDAYQFVTQWTSPGASGKWTIKSSIANNRDAFDAPLRVNPGEPVNWTVTYTDTPTNLTGVFQDRGGRVATDYFILVFPTDRTYWTPGSRRVQMTRPATDGAFVAKGLPAGEYFLAALTDLEAGEWNDPTLLDQLVKSSIKATLRDGQTTTQDLRIGG